ncbi:MAG: FUSC family protein [Oscillospiraceae bacterium]
MKEPQKHLKLGMRSIKTAIAIFVCILLYEIMHSISLNFIDNEYALVKAVSIFISRTDPVFACIASIIVMQNTIEDSWERGKSRIIGTFLGGIIGLITLYADMAIYNREFTIFMVPMGVLFVIWFCNIIGKPNAISFAAITLTIIMLAVDKYNYPAYLYALHRTVDTAIGVLIAMVVNLSLKKPQSIEQEGVNDD